MIRLMLAVTFLDCLLIAMLVIVPYSKTAAVIIWFLGSGTILIKGDKRRSCMQAFFISSLVGSFGFSSPSSNVGSN